MDFPYQLFKSYLLSLLFATELMISIAGNHTADRLFIKALYDFIKFKAADFAGAQFGSQCLYLVLFLVIVYGKKLLRQLFWWS